MNCALTTNRFLSEKKSYPLHRSLTFEAKMIEQSIVNTILQKQQTLKEIGKKVEGKLSEP